jgi:hypothetical protein
MRMDEEVLFEVQWKSLIACFGDLDASAKSAGALTRKRGVQSAEALLRLALVYAYTNKSLRETVAWAEGAGMSRMSDVALLKRLRGCGPWLGQLIAAKLAERNGRLGLKQRADRVRLVDATSLSLPGSRGTDRRIHLSLDLGTLSIDRAELSGPEQGESLDHFDLSAGELVVADRGYAHRAALHRAHTRGGRFLVRLPWKNVPLQDAQGKAFDVLAFARQLEDAQPAETSLYLRAPGVAEPIAVRLLVLRKTEAAAEVARSKRQRQSVKRGHRVDIRSLEAAGYILLLSNCTHLSPIEAFELYRMRWQVELAFKRLKSLIHLDHITAKEDRVVQTYILGKLLAALMIEDLTERYLAFSPWGFPLVPTTYALAVDQDHR